MEKLENGKYMLNGQELNGDDYTNMFVAECPCGWSELNNEMWAYDEFQRHACLTKAGKPRKKKLQGLMRRATVAELWADHNAE